MKKEELFQILGEVDDEFLDENVTEIKHSTSWITAVVSIAACIAVSAGLIYLIPKPSEDLRNPAESALQSETSVTTSVQTVTETQQETDFQEIPLYFDLYTATDPVTSYEHPYDAHPMIEIEISENPEILYISETPQVISVHDSLDSSGRPKQYEFTVTDTGYRARNNDFTLERIDENTLILHSASNRYKVYDGMTLSRQNTPYYLLKDIQPENIAYVSWQLPEESEPEFSYPAEQAFPEELAGILQNMHIYAKSGCVSYARWVFTVTMQDGTEHTISQPEGLQNRFYIDDILYYSDTDFYPFAEYIAKMAELSETVQNTESIPETTAVNTTVPETTTTITTETTTTTQPATAETNQIMTGKSGVQVLPYVTTEGQTVPEPVVLPDIQTSFETQIIMEEQYPETTVQSETTATETIPEMTVQTETTTIPEFIQSGIIEEMGVIYAAEWENIDPWEFTQGVEKDWLLSNVMQYYPDKKYCIAVHPATVQIEEEGEEYPTPEEFLNDLGIQILGRRKDNELVIIADSEQIEKMGQSEYMGFVAVLNPVMDFDQ